MVVQACMYASSCNSRVGLVAVLGVFQAAGVRHGGARRGAGGLDRTGRQSTSHGQAGVWTWTSNTQEDKV